MRAWKKGNVWRATGFLVALAGFLAAATLVPMMREDPTLDAPAVELPAMTNVPPATDLLRVE